MANEFDRVMQENLKTLSASAAHQVFGIDPANLIPRQRKMQRTLERETDWLFEVVDHDNGNYLLHIEWQMTNDRHMGNRMLLYHALARITYRLPVRGLVIYAGMGKLNMPAEIKEYGLQYEYRVVDMKDADPESFLQSDMPGELLLAVLAGRTEQEEKRAVVRKILYKLQSLLYPDGQELKRKIAQLEILGKLRNIQHIIVEEEQTMPIVYDLKTDIRYLQGQEQGLEEGARIATAERNTAFVIFLLQHTDHPDEKIAEIVGVSLDFVLEVKNRN